MELLLTFLLLQEKDKSLAIFQGPSGKSQGQLKIKILFRIWFWEGKIVKNVKKLRFFKCEESQFP